MQIHHYISTHTKEHSREHSCSNAIQRSASAPPDSETLPPNLKAFIIPHTTSGHTGLETEALKLTAVSVRLLACKPEQHTSHATGQQGQYKQRHGGPSNLSDSGSKQLSREWRNLLTKTHPPGAPRGPLMNSLL